MDPTSREIHKPCADWIPNHLKGDAAVGAIAAVAERTAEVGGSAVGSILPPKLTRRRDPLRQVDRKSRKSRKSRNSGGERPSSLLQVYFTSASSACGGDVCFGKYTSLLLGGGFYFSAVLH